MKLSEIAKHTDAEVEGKGDIEIEGLAGIEEAGPNEITFLSNRRYRSRLKTTRAGAVYLGPGEEAPPGCPVLRSRNPYLSFAKAIDLFYQRPNLAVGIHPSAVIDPTARLGMDVAIGPNAVIDAEVVIGDRTEIGANVTIHRGAILGDECVLHSSAVVREYVRLGNRVILQNGAVIGADGFGFAPMEGGNYYKMTQAGTVILEDDVEVGANTTVDRATVGATMVGRGTKLDNLVMVGHGSTIGEDTVLAAQTGLGGSAKVGSRVMMGGQVGVGSHLTVGDNVICAGKTGVTRSVKEGAQLAGYPEMPIALWRRALIALERLPDALKRLRRVERALGLDSEKDEH
jgi:UDP-3-O-[3-hydroxymyristoyl] glucosamine N-acyltransferase